MAVNDEWDQAVFAELVEAVFPGDTVEIEGGLAFKVARAGDSGLGLWSDDGRCWVYGGGGANAKSLRAIRHWLAQRCGVEYRSDCHCPRCGGPGRATMVEGFGGADDLEVYRVSCIVCGDVRWQHDARDIEAEVEALWDTLDPEKKMGTMDFVKEGMRREWELRQEYLDDAGDDEDELYDVGTEADGTW